MKKILFVVESLSGGGAEKALLTLIKSLNKEKYQITVFTIIETGVYVKMMKKYCRVKFALREYNSYSMVGKLLYKLKHKIIYSFNINLVYSWLIKEKYDIEIAFVEGFDTKFVAASNNKFSKKYAWVHTDVINNSDSDKCFSSFAEQKKAYCIFDKVICVSNDAKKQFVNKFKINNVMVIYNLIESKEIAQFRINNYEIKDKINLCAVGRLEKEKGFDRLILALSNLSQFNYELVIIGKGTQESNLKRLVSEYGMSERVKFTGFIENPYPQIAKANLLICSSRIEGFSLVIAEAMILGIPVLSTKCAGPIELTENGRYGLIVENNQVAIQQKLFEILNDVNQLYEFHQKSLERSKFFEMDYVLNVINNILDT